MAKIEELTQDDIDRMESALDRYKTENQKFRTQRDEYKAAAEAGEVNEKFKKAALTAEAKLRLSTQGIKDPDRILKYLTFDDVEFDDEGKLPTLDQKIEVVKTDFPELFDAKRRVGGRVDAGANTPANVAPKSLSEMQIDKLYSR